VLAELADHVVSLELESHFVKPAQSRLTELGIFNASIIQMDGSSGYDVEAPYNRIIVTAGAPAVTPLLLEQLAVNGRMVIPVGDRVTQVLQIWKKDADGHPSCDEHISVVFVPLRGKFGWY
jgi:protein-L-isoaspartate(D-aspartate) O-methyltransferase